MKKENITPEKVRDMIMTMSDEEMDELWKKLWESPYFRKFVSKEKRLTMGENKIIDTFWFTGQETIGIVTVEDTLTGERKAYIGTGEGHSAKADANKIKDWGVRVHYSHLRGVLEWLNSGNTTDK